MQSLHPAVEVETHRCGESELTGLMQETGDWKQAQLFLQTGAWCVWMSLTRCQMLTGSLFMKSWSSRL